MSTGLQCGSRPKRRSLGLSRKWLSPAAQQNSSKKDPEGSGFGLDVGLGPSPNSSKEACNQETLSRTAVIKNESPRSASPVVNLLKGTPNRLVSRYSTSRKRQFKAMFKSPMKEVDGVAPNEEELDDVQQEITNLKKQIQLMKEEEDELRKCGFNEEELQVHIEKLHEYNELKDTGQMLIGKIATLEGRTTSEMYEQFGLDLED